MTEHLHTDDENCPFCNVEKSFVTKMDLLQNATEIYAETLGRVEKFMGSGKEFDKAAPIEQYEKLTVDLLTQLTTFTIALAKDVVEINRAVMSMYFLADALVDRMIESEEKDES